MGGSGSQKQTTSLPPWATPYAKEGLEGSFNYYLPGGQPGPYTGPNQSVAPLTPNQQISFDAARNLTENVPGMFSPYTAGTPYPTGAPYPTGGMYGPADPTNMNQFLDPYAKAAAQGLTTEFETATAPNIMNRAAQTGTLMSSGNQQEMKNAESALSSGLSDLYAKIYEPAWESAQNRGLSAYEDAQNRGMSAYEAAQNRGLSAYEGGQNRGLSATQGDVQSQLAANQALQQAGGQEQQQGQNVLDTIFGNQMRAFQWPQQAYQNLAGLFSGFLGNQSTTKVTGGSK